MTTTRARRFALATSMLLSACGSDDRGAAAAGVDTAGRPAPADPVGVTAPAPEPVGAKGPAPAAPEPPPIGDEPLLNGKPSLAALGQEVVAALAASDREALWALSVSEREYTRLFAALVSHPNMLRFGPKLAWASQLEDNRDAVSEAMKQHGGKGYAFVSLEPTRTEERGGLVIYRDPKLTVKDGSGVTLEPKVIDVAVEHVESGTFLVLTFAD